MFTGIIEALGKVISIESHGTNKDFILESDISSSLKIDQSLSHNGVCLTVVNLFEDRHTVTAIHETLKKSNLGQLNEGDIVNLERCTRVGDRLDGHMVQGHVDKASQCTSVQEIGGSWKFTFSLPASDKHLLIPQGSICINGVSLTISDLNDSTFSVAIIPYTFEHTTFKNIQPGDWVNLEYDVLGKYIYRMHQLNTSENG